MPLVFSESCCFSESCWEFALSIDFAEAAVRTGSLCTAKIKMNTWPLLKFFCFKKLTHGVFYVACELRVRYVYVTCM